MRVALGAIVGTTGGPATYALELVRALSEVFPADRWVVLTDRPDGFARFAETVHVPLASTWEQPLWDHWHVRRLLRSVDPDLYHGTKGVIPRGISIPAVVTVHDLAVRVFPKTFRWPQRMHLNLETPSTIQRARRVLADSRSTAVDLARFYPAAANKTEVVPLAASRTIRPPLPADVERWKTARGIKDLAIGYLGTLQPRKNLDLLAAAFARAARSRPWRLVVAGRMRPGYRPACLDGGDPRIRYLGELDDREVPLFLAGMACMVSPSSYEGFGLTFLEAMAAGCPVIGVANSSVLEVVGDAGVLVERADVSLLAEAIERVATDIAVATDLSRRGVERAALFSWPETARRTRAVYERALSA
jgi:alpha-1,3-rhamnosyl/mannosyltransferase